MEIPSGSGNKYQYADVIHNDDNVIDVVVNGNQLQVIYRVTQDMDLSWIGSFLSNRGYEHKSIEVVGQNVKRDTFETE